MQIMQGSPPKIIHIKFGNLKLSEFEEVINTCWAQVAELIKTHSVINIYQNTIEAIK
jgi:predicted nuclease of predicted toxin-antitoxin system